MLDKTKGADGRVEERAKQNDQAVGQMKLGVAVNFRMCAFQGGANRQNRLHQLEAHEVVFLDRLFAFGRHAEAECARDRPKAQVKIVLIPAR